MKFVAFILGIVVVFTFNAAEILADPVPVKADSEAVQGPKIYVDCSNCDLDYLRTEINFVNFVRDRKLADVDVLVTTQQTGSGGTEYMLEFIGLAKYEGMRDTLRFDVMKSAADDTVRKEMVRTIKLGVIRYAMKTPIAGRLSIKYAAPEKAGKLADPWNHWVFEVSANPYFSGEESYHYINFWGSLSAHRVTDAAKTGIDVSWSYSESRYKYTVDSEEVTTISLSRSKNLEVWHIISLGRHWSAGMEGSALNSTYNNLDFRIFLSPAVEYNFFPYDQSTRRQLRLQYEIKSSFANYHETTIFDKTKEWLFSQTLTAALQLTQPWGSVSTQLNGSNYFHDFRKNSLEFYGKLSLRLVKGLSMDFQGDVSRIHNQIYLPRGDATQEDILLRQRQMATEYQYWASVGLSYSFGSIYNNVVNPRFGI